MESCQLPCTSCTVRVCTCCTSCTSCLLEVMYGSMFLTVFFFIFGLARWHSCVLGTGERLAETLWSLLKPSHCRCHSLRKLFCGRNTNTPSALPMAERISLAKARDTTPSDLMSKAQTSYYMIDWCSPGQDIRQQGVPLSIPCSCCYTALSQACAKTNEASCLPPQMKSAAANGFF